MKSFLDFISEMEGMYDHKLEGLKDVHADVYVRHHKDINGRSIYTAYHQGNKIASAKLSGQGHYVSDLDVLPHFRRKGVATALYDHIEKHTGKKLIPSPMYQTDDGKAFWAARKEKEVKEETDSLFGPIYHRTNSDLDKLSNFDVSKAKGSSVLGPALYATYGDSRWKPTGEDKGRVLSGHVRGKIIDLTRPQTPEEMAPLEQHLGRKLDSLPLMSLEKRHGSVAAGLKAAGYAAAIHHGPGSTGKHIAVFDPKNIVDSKEVKEETDYRGEHQAPGPSDGSPMHDVTKNGTYPKDFYSPNGFRYYSDSGSDLDRESHDRVTRFKDKPDDKVWIYRAVPKSIQKAAMKTENPTDHMIRKGDWVTIHKGYAKEHGEANLNNDYHVAAKRVPASHIYTNGDSIHEWGYHPPEKN